jgi:imidazolonepropionase
MNRAQGALWHHKGIIQAVGPTDEILSRAGKDAKQIDCQGRAMIPGLVDPHTHMCFAQTRENEFSERICGVPYLEILKRGGGILNSVDSVRRASVQDLLKNTLEHLKIALAHGSTTVEIKSGYGLDTENELKMLSVIELAGQKAAQDIAATFLGAHAIPREYKEHPDQYVDLIINEMIPKVADQGIASFADVFCEKGVFTPEQSRRILEAAMEHGLTPKLHADEVNDLGGGAMAADLKAVSADHLLAVSPKSIAKMAQAQVVAVLLPATAYSLKKTYAPARKMLNAGLAVALATDCNPGSSYVLSMPFAIGLAIMQMGLSVEEALTAATLNAAHALNLARKVGSLEPGKQADFCLLHGETPAVIAYRAGVNPMAAVYKKGRLAAST